MPSLAVLVVLAFAAFRITRLVVEDTITDPIRGWFYDLVWDSENPRTVTLPDGRRVLVPSPRHGGFLTWLYDLVTCPWCLGVWVSVAVYCAWRFGTAHDGNVVDGILAVAAIAGGQGAIGQWVVSNEPDAVEKIAVVPDDREEGPTVEEA